MPSKHTSGTTSTDRPTFPALAADLDGEDPARFLASDMDPRPLIRGLRDDQRAAAYLAVARRLGCRDAVIEALETKLTALREGEG